MVEMLQKTPTVPTVETMRQSVELLLAQIKTLPTTGFNDVATISKVASDGISLVNELASQLYNSGTGPSPKDKESLQDLIKRLVEGLSSVRLPDGDKRSRNLANLIAHYRTEWLPNDEELVERFQKARAEYSEKPEDIEASKRFGWVLHECLKASYKRLLNVKLTEFFLKQFEEWRYLGEVNEGIEKLLATRKKDIESAKDFLFSPIDAQRLYNDKEWHKAIVACEFFLASHPENAVAWRLRANARLQLLLEAKKVGDLASLANQTALFLEAASEFASHIPSSEESAKLVLDAVSEQYWVLAKTAKNPTAGKKQDVTFLCNSLIKAFLSLSQVFSMLISDETDKSTQRRCVDTATRLVDAIYWEATRHPYKNSNKKAFADISKSFASLIHTWGLDSLGKEDRDWHASGSRRRPLAARIVLALLACVSLGDAADIVGANPWLLRFCETEANLFKDDPSAYCSRMSEAMLKLGEKERARSYALQVVRQNQTEKWRWRLLASTFPKDSQEQKDCLFMDNKVFLPFLKLFSPDIAISQEKTIALQRERAYALLAMDAKRFPGIVISCFTEGQGTSSHEVGFSHKQFIRVWWRDDNGLPCFDFVPRESMGADDLTTGAPVLVTVSESLGTAKAVNVEPRKEGRPFDIYPYATGVVIARNESRHHLNVAYGLGKNCNIDTKRFQSANELKDGGLCEVALFEREGMAPIVLDIKSPSKETVRPSFSKVFSGILVRDKGRRDAHIDDILVPASLFDRAMLDHEATGVAVANAKTEAEDPFWIAVSCKKPLNDLEVSP